MEKDRNLLEKKILESFRRYYNITETGGDFFRARCDYFEKSETFLVTQKANLWTADGEEFIFVFSTENLTLEKYLQAVEFVDSEWKNLAHIGPGHMYTYVTPLFICDSAQEDALKQLKKCRTYKSFRFSFHGWMEYHMACIETGREKITTNFRGRCVKKSLMKILGR